MTRPIPPVRVQARITRQLTEGEARDRAESASRALQDLLAQRTALAVYLRKERAAIKTAERQIEDLTRAHTTRQEVLDVEAERHFSLKRRLTWLEYEGRHYDERSMTADELAACQQETLFGDGPDVAGRVWEGAEEKPDPQEELGYTRAPRGAGKARGVYVDRVPGLGERP